METARCRAVLAAAETGSFSRAAEVLRYTPSGVNQLVTAFENELGFSVFRRSTKGVSLTENGQLLLPTVREFLRQEDRLFELATEINGLLIGSVTIAAYSSIATHWLPAVIRAFQQDYPHVSIRLMEGIWQEVSGWLDDRTADIGFFSYQDGMPYEWIPLAEDPMLALLPPDHPLAGASAYPLKDCEQDDFIMPSLGCDDDVEALFRRNGIVPKIRFTTMESFSAMSMVEQSLGISVMNQLITEGHICNIVKLPLDPPSQITMGVALHSKADASPAVKMFLKYAVRMLTRTESAQ
jgi:DNA-binding transcriptional LysR family regulator